MLQPLALLLAALPLSAPSAQITVDGVEATFATTPNLVTITGTGFGPTTQVTIGGLAAQVVGQTPTSLQVLPQPSIPGFLDLVVSDGARTVTATGAAQRFPTFVATNDGLGGTVEFEVAIGDVGVFETALGLATLPSPLPIAGIQYGLLLDPGLGLFQLSSGLAPSGAAVVQSFPAPTEPALLGVELPLQAFAQRGLTGSATFSFTNVTTLDFQGVSFPPPANLAYADAAPVYTIGEPIVPNTPSVDGVVSEFGVAVLPQFGLLPLPAGLTLDPETGALSGTPSGSSGTTQHLIVAANAAGETSVVLPITLEQPEFELISISVPVGATWQINRPIEFQFNQPVDFSTISASSIPVVSIFGVPAVGEYLVGLDQNGVPDPSLIVFQPRCPIEPDLADAGLTPGGEIYQVRVLGEDAAGGLPVAAQSGELLGQSGFTSFMTPTGSELTELFFDSQPGPPTLAYRENGLGGDGVDATRVALLESFEQRYFDLDTDLGQIELEPFSLSEPAYPLNTYSDPGSQFELLLVFNQPVAPGVENVSPDRLRLEARSDAGSPWVGLPTDVRLEANCTLIGARVALRPLGTLPPGAELRAVVEADFTDIVGDSALIPEALGDVVPLQPPVDLFDPFDPDPTALVDEVFESFDVGGLGSFEDVAAEFVEPRASWGGGSLTASTGFEGTGGPGGNFDFRIVSGETFVLSTDVAQIVGGPGFVPTAAQTVVNGVVQVRDLLIEDGGRLIVIGPNPARILATGDVSILGEIDISGIDSQAVSQLNSPNIPQPGAVGVGGGGRGGTGSPLTTSSTPKGGDGFGAFGVPGGGGVGGESGFFDSFQDELTRGAGGGGGRLAADFDPAFDDGFQVNAKLGGPGAATATGAVTGVMPPQPGALGQSIFTDLNPDLTPNGSNDFWGAQEVAPGVVVIGELSAPTAGTGGGGGGDSIDSPVFPATQFVLTDEKKAGGGGGGAGQLRVEALGDLRIGSNGRVVANGGRGGEGESTGGTNQIGGAGAGGSGGHVVLQTAGTLDLSADPMLGALQALGGEGGIGQGDQTNDVVPPANGSGGDGGAGVIQIHVSSFAQLTGAAQPGTPGVILPFGEFDVAAYLDRISAPNAKRLVPTFGTVSRARSLPLALGGAALVDPSVQPLFALLGLSEDGLGTAGVDESGQVLTTAGQVDLTEALFERSGPTVTPSGTSLLSIDGDMREVVLALDAAAVAALSDPANGIVLCYHPAGFPIDCGTDPNQIERVFLDDSYVRNTALLRGARLGLDGPGAGSDETFTVELAIATPVVPGDAAQGIELRLFLASEEGSLAPFVGLSPAILDFALRPRTFRARSGAALDVLGNGQSIEVRAQVLAAGPDGQPDLANPVTPFTGDARILSAPGVAGQADFIRFDVLFDAGPDSGSALPALDFLRLPFRF